MRTCTCLGAAREAVVKPFSWEITVGIVAPRRIIANTELSITIGAPALDGRIILRQ